MHKVWGTQFSQYLEGFGAGIDRGVDVLIFNEPTNDAASQHKAIFRRPYRSTPSVLSAFMTMPCDGNSLWNRWRNHGASALDRSSSQRVNCNHQDNTSRICDSEIKRTECAVICDNKNTRFHSERRTGENIIRTRSAYVGVRLDFVIRSAFLSGPAMPDRGISEAYRKNIPPSICQKVKFMSTDFPYNNVLFAGYHDI